LILGGLFTIMKKQGDSSYYELDIGGGGRELASECEIKTVKIINFALFVSRKILKYLPVTDENKIV
jgi:hypothetical protein